MADDFDPDVWIDRLRTAGVQPIKREAATKQLMPVDEAQSDEINALWKQIQNEGRMKAVWDALVVRCGHASPWEILDLSKCR